MAFLIGLVIGILAGGYGGYKYGSSVQSKAQAIVAAVKK
jgi:hypothetical protein